MSGFGGMDQGVEGDRPTMGRMVAYQHDRDEFVPAVVLKIYPDGWTVDLAPQDGGPVVQLVPYGGGKEFGELQPGSWATLEEFEGWKIWSDERSDKRRREESDAAA